MKKLGCKIAGLVCLLLISVFFFTGIPGPNYWRAKRFSAAVAQKLPLGASKSQVLIFLQQEKIEYSYDDSDLDFESVVRDAHLKAPQLSGIALSIIRETSWGFLYTADVQFVFFFDKKGKLIKVSQDESGTGP